MKTAAAMVAATIVSVIAIGAVVLAAYVMMQALVVLLEMSIGMMEELTT